MAGRMAMDDVTWKDRQASAKAKTKRTKMLPWRYECRAGLFCNRALKTGENFLMGNIASPRTDAGCPIRCPQRRERVSFMIHLRG